MKSTSTVINASVSPAADQVAELASLLQQKQTTKIKKKTKNEIKKDATNPTGNANGMLQFSLVQRFTHFVVNY